MVTRTRLARLAGGCLAAALITLALGNLPAEAARKRKRVRQSGALALRTVNVAQTSAVPLNRVIEFHFNRDVDPTSVDPAVFQVRGQNGTRTGFTRQVFGDFQVAGRFVRFFPRLPTHLRDDRGAFFPAGSSLDDATENSGLEPSTEYEIRVLGRPFVSPVRSRAGRPLRRTYVTRFTTAPAFDPAEQFETVSYGDTPPPQFAFSNPPDTVPSVADQYAATGGSKGVPNDLDVSLFCTKVPLSPTTARVLRNVEFTLLERKGDPALRRPVAGTVFVEQNFDTTLLEFRPDFPLSDLGVYALRVSKLVRDLTEQHDFAENRQRAHLRRVYDQLSEFRAQVGGPAELLPDPNAEFIPDWPGLSDPSAAAERGVLKANLLALGDARPEEVDPRIMVLFSTRDEPVSDASLRVEFTKGEELFDPKLSTGEVDASVPGAASGIFTIAGGSAVDGDFFPETDMTIALDAFADHSINWRKVVVPEGVTVSFTGTRPARVHALQIEINGTLSVDGGRGGKGVGTGNSASGSYYNGPPPLAHRPDAGVPGPGGGLGGRPATKFQTVSQAPGVAGDAGEPGVGVDGLPAAIDVGGQGGLGGVTSASSAYTFGGAGGGGGAREAGGVGAGGTSGARTPPWDGVGGLGGGGSQNVELAPLVGGAGGGGGGNSTYTSLNWHKYGAAGGGGGGAILIQTPGILRIGASGSVTARGGAGGDGTPNNTGTITSAPGGGGGGGSILLRSTAGFDIVDPAAALDVSGGAGGVNTAPRYKAPKGGDGGAGYIRVEDPNGGLSVANGTGGVYDPVGAGVPSFVYTKFADLGVTDARVLEFANEDIATDPTTNDAVLVEIQMTREDPRSFGQPDLGAVDQESQDSLDETITSAWIPVKVHDRTGLSGGAFQIAGYDPAVQGLEHTFGVADRLNDRGYRYVRYRLTFQNDASQSRTDPLPSCDSVEIHFQFNF